MWQKFLNFLLEIDQWILHEEKFLKVEEHLLSEAIKKNKHRISGFHFKRIFIPHPANNFRPYSTHHHTLSMLLLGLFLFKVTVLSLFIPLDHTYASGISSEQLVKMTNEARAAEHLSQLTVNHNLIQAARMKALDMFENQYWSHTSPSGITPWYWFDEIGYIYEHAGENLAMDFHSTEGVFEG